MTTRQRLHEVTTDSVGSFDPATWVQQYDADSVANMMAELLFNPADTLYYTKELGLTEQQLQVLAQWLPQNVVVTSYSPDSGSDPLPGYRPIRQDFEQKVQQLEQVGFKHHYEILDIATSSEGSYLISSRVPLDGQKQGPMLSGDCRKLDTKEYIRFLKGYADA